MGASAGSTLRRGGVRNSRKREPARERHTEPLQNGEEAAQPPLQRRV